MSHLGSCSIVYLDYWFVWVLGWSPAHTGKHSATELCPSPDNCFLSSSNFLFVSQVSVSIYQIDTMMGFTMTFPHTHVIHFDSIHPLPPFVPLPFLLLPFLFPSKQLWQFKWEFKHTWPLSPSLKTGAVCSCPVLFKGSRLAAPGTTLALADNLPRHCELSPSGAVS